jgi:hypothetical protein
MQYGENIREHVQQKAENIFRNVTIIQDKLVTRIGSFGYHLSSWEDKLSCFLKAVIDYTYTITLENSGLASVHLLP